MLAFHIVVWCPAASWSWWKTLIQHRSMLNQSSRQKWNVTPNCEVWAGASDDWGVWWSSHNQLSLRCGKSRFGVSGPGIPLRCFHRAKGKSLLQMEMLDYRCRGRGLREERWKTHQLVLCLVWEVFIIRAETHASESQSRGHAWR